MKLNNISENQIVVNSRERDKAYYEVLKDKLEQPLKGDVRARAFNVDRHNQHAVFFVDTSFDRTDVTYDHATIWYRSMWQKEYDSLWRNKKLPLDYYSGISSHYSYCKDWIKNTGNYKYLVAFRMKLRGNEFLQKITEYKNQFPELRNIKMDPKPEEVGVSIGLGKTGHYKGRAGELWNDMMNRHEITWRLVYFRLDLGIDDVKIKQQLTNVTTQYGN